MKEKLSNLVSFFLMATQLKYKLRSGWDENHWQVKAERLESVAEHVYGTCILALAIDSEFELNLDINRVIKMLVLHEIGEVLIGDITPFENITPEEKMKREHVAMEKMLDGLIKKEEYLELLLEFDEKETLEGKFAFHCDKLEADIQCKYYQDIGAQTPISEQQNNPAFNFESVQKAIDNGAKNVFEIWYYGDKHIHADDEIFSSILEFVKEENIKTLIS